MTEPRHQRPQSIYTGDRDQLGNVVVCADGLMLDWESTLKLRNHSPTGPEWGYCGSGPAQLALALLVHALRGQDLVALELYQEYKRQVVALWDKNHWTTTRVAILQWVAQQPQYLHADLGREGGGET